MWFSSLTLPVLLPEDLIQLQVCIRSVAERVKLRGQREEVWAQQDLRLQAPCSSSRRLCCLPPSQRTKVDIDSLVRTVLAKQKIIAIVPFVFSNKVVWEGTSKASKAKVLLESIFFRLKWIWLPPRQVSPLFLRPRRLFSVTGNSKRTSTKKE